MKVQEEASFKISQDLISRYSSELAFQDFSKRLKDQKSDLDSQIEKGFRPLELRVDKISNIGRVEVIFTKNIKFPNNFGQVIRES